MVINTATHSNENLSFWQIWGVILEIGCLQWIVMMYLGLSDIHSYISPDFRIGSNYVPIFQNSKDIKKKVSPNILPNLYFVTSSKLFFFGIIA